LHQLVVATTTNQFIILTRAGLKPDYALVSKMWAPHLYFSTFVSANLHF